MEYLSVLQVSKQYQGKPVIQNICLDVQKGERVCILGASGIGKTTLFNIVSGLEKPDEGSVWLNGKDITGQSGQMSYMQQKDLLLPFQTILDNVCVPLRLKGVDKKAAREQAAPYFAEFGLQGYEKKYPSQLSGGMRQRAALLRSYLFSGDVMLLDEPFSALDALTKTAMHDWFMQFAATHNTTTLLITHDVDEAIVLSNRIYIMAGRPGRITREFGVDAHAIPPQNFTTSDAFIRLKRQILEVIGQ